MLRTRLARMETKALQHHAQRMPVNGSDNLQRQQGMPGEGRQYRAIRQIHACSRQVRSDHGLAVLVAADGDLDLRAGRTDPKLIGHVHAKEWRDVEFLGTTLFDRPVGLAFARNGVAMPLPERVVDFVDNRSQLAILAIAEVHTQRIEPITENARHAEEHDLSTLHVALGLLQQRLRLASKRRVAAVAVIAVVKAREIEPVAGTQREPGGKSIDLVEVDQHPEYAIAKTMHAGPQTTMCEAAGIET